MEPQQMRVQSIRFGRTAWERIQAAALHEGVSASQYVREAALIRAMLQEQRRGEPVSLFAREVALEVRRLNDPFDPPSGPPTGDPGSRG